MATGSGEWVGERLGNGALTKSQRVDKWEDSENGHTTGGPGGDIEMEPVDAGLLGRDAAIGRRRRVQLAWDGSAPGEVQSRMVVLGDQNNDLPGGHRMGKRDWGGLAQAVAEASQEDGLTRAAGSNDGFGEDDNPILVDSQPLHGDRSVHQESVLHVRGSTRGKERSCPGGTRGGKWVGVGKTRKISSNLAGQVMHGKRGRGCRHGGVKAGNRISSSRM
jgi:hypothetical protein